MARMTYFVVQPYVPIPGSSRIGRADPIQAPDIGAAKRIVQSLPNGMIGAIAFSRSGDTEEGEWDDAIIIAKNGKLPEEANDEEVPW